MRQHENHITTCARRRPSNTPRNATGPQCAVTVPANRAAAESARFAALLVGAGGRNRGRLALFRHFVFRSAANSRTGCPDCARRRAPKSQARYGRGLGVGAVGIGVGTVLATVARRFFAPQLPDPRDSPWILGGVAALLLLQTVLACVVPVRRALAVDPLTALRSE